MGSRRDDLIDNENDDAAEAALRRALAHLGEPTLVEPPADLVTRTMRQVPAMPPAAAARSRQIRQLGYWALSAVLVFCALVIASGMLGSGPLPALVGDGTSGLGHTLLTIQLALKPLLRTIGSAGVPLLLGGLLALAANSWLLRRFSRGISSIA